ncbi:MAG: CBS domain-containing protein [Candidatus Ranarchaeia archaeon]
MRVEKVMSTEVDYVEVPGTREEVLERFRETGRVGFPVVKKGTQELVGLITQSDLMTHPDENQIGILMTRDPLTLKPGSPISRAAKIFLNEAVRRIPITKDGKLVGILTVHDLVNKVVARMEGYQPIKPYIKKRITCVWHNTPLTVAAEIMRLAQKQAVPVLDDDGKLIGMITDVELLRQSQVVMQKKKSAIASAGESEKWAWDASGVLYIEKRLLKLPSDVLVKDAMMPELITVNEHTSIADCAKKMFEKNIDTIPVMTTDNELGGVIRDLDLLKTLLPNEGLKEE